MVIRVFKSWGSLKRALRSPNYWVPGFFLGGGGEVSSECYPDFCISDAAMQR